MKTCIIIPAHNEEAYIGRTLQSLVGQTLLPNKVVVVDDHATDRTAEVVRSFVERYPFVSLVKNISSEARLPGSKVIQAFYKGLETSDDDYDILCKFDADLIFPENYLETIVHTFKNHPRCGMVGGFCLIESGGEWRPESLTGKDHIRGALKAYRKTCFEDIGGLRLAMGWDTADELLARYHGWEVRTVDGLWVQHLRPTGRAYDQAARYRQGAAFYALRYGFWLTLIASLKLAWKKRRPLLLVDYIKGFHLAKRQGKPPLVTAAEGAFIRKFRWKNIRGKFFPVKKKL